MRLLGLIAAAALTAGCAKTYVRIDVDYAVKRGDRTQPSVRTTTTYKAKASTLKTVSVRLPEYCLTESSAQASGRARRTNKIMESSCAVWLSELERALAGGGYRVISWDTLYKLERTRGVSTYVAARELGADAVVMINSLEANMRSADAGAEGTIQYFYSMPDGRKVVPARLSATTRVSLKRLIRRSLGMGRKGGNMLSAAMDATVIVTTTGESAYFYRWNITRNLTKAGARTFLFRGRGVNFRPIRPKLRLAKLPKLDTRASVEVSHTETKGRVNPFRKGRMELVRTMARDFVSRLKRGGAQ